MKRCFGSFHHSGNNYDDGLSGYGYRDKDSAVFESVKGVKAGANANEAQLVDGEGNVVFLLKK